MGVIQFLRQKFVKNIPALTLVSNFLQIFRMQIIFPRPGGGTIAAGNRDSPPGRALPAAERVELRKCLRVSFPHAPFPRSRSGFCSIFFSRRIPSWIPPFPSLVGRFLATFLQHFAQFWLKVGCRVFVMFFGSVF